MAPSPLTFTLISCSPEEKTMLQRSSSSSFATFCDNLDRQQQAHNSFFFFFCLVYESSKQPCEDHRTMTDCTNSVISKFSCNHRTFSDCRIFPQKKWTRISAESTATQPTLSAMGILIRTSLLPAGFAELCAEPFWRALCTKGSEPSKDHRTFPTFSFTANLQNLPGATKLCQQVLWNLHKLAEPSDPDGGAFQ